MQDEIITANEAELQAKDAELQAKDAQLQALVARLAAFEGVPPEPSNPRSSEAECVWLLFCANATASSTVFSNSYGVRCRAFKQIARFVRDNPTEVVIIDLNGNWFGMDEDKNFHDKLEDELNQK